MNSFERNARLRRSPLSKWIIDLKTWIEHLRWKFSGDGRQAPSAVAKRRIILDMLLSCNLRTVVETGTFLGDTTHFLSSRGYHVLSVEIDPQLATLARARFNRDENVQIIEGDSGKLMPDLIAELDQPALFYLDGHYSGSERERVSTKHRSSKRSRRS